MNVKLEYIGPNLVFIFAAEDIKQGQELLIDYIPEVQGLNLRKAFLSKYGIKEEK